MSTVSRKKQRKIERIVLGIRIDYHEPKQADKKGPKRKEAIIKMRRTGRHADAAEWYDSWSGLGFKGSRVRCKG